MFAVLDHHLHMYRLMTTTTTRVTRQGPLRCYGLINFGQRFVLESLLFYSATFSWLRINSTEALLQNFNCMFEKSYSSEFGK